MLSISTWSQQRVKLVLYLMREIEANIVHEWAHRLHIQIQV